MSPPLGYSGSLAHRFLGLQLTPLLAVAALLAEVLQGLEKRLPLLQSQGLRGIAAELRRHDALLGARLRVDGREGVGAGIDNEGRLLLQLPQGAPEPQLSGHVELLG